MQHIKDFSSQVKLVYANTLLALEIFISSDAPIFYTVLMYNTIDIFITFACLHKNITDLLKQTNKNTPQKLVFTLESAECPQPPYTKEI